MPFDIQAARQAGKTDAQIAAYLGQSLGFDVDSAVKAGKTPTQIAEYLSMNDAPPTVAPQEKPGFFSSVGSDIVKRAGNVADVFTNNEPNPRMGFNTFPSKILQTAGQAAGLVNDVAIEGVKAGYRALPQGVQDFIGERTKAVIQGVDAPPIREGAVSLGEAYQGAKTMFPEGMRNVEAVANIAGAVPIVKGAAVAGQAVKTAGKEAVNIAKDVTAMTAGLSETELKGKLKAVIKYGIEKGIRPSTAGKGDAALTQKYFDRADDAVMNIVGNKDNLVLTDYHGNTITGKLPQTLKQFSDAVDQTKRNIFRQYDDMTKQAGQAGAAVDLSPVASALEKEAGSVVLQDNATSVANYAAKKAEIFTKRGSYTAQETQDAIASYNASLEAFYKNPTPQAANKARIDAIIVQNLRKSLDDTIENAVGDGYQELKNAYGSMKAVEKDIAHRAIVDARKNVKGLVDFADIFTSGELLAGLATMNPKMIIRAGAWKAVKEYFKAINNPNYIIKDMFKNVEHIVEKGRGGFKSKTIQKMATPTQSLQMGP